MSKFFRSDATSIDPDVVKMHEDYARSISVATTDSNGGTSPEQYLAEYREREPYHYIEEGSDGYYYWQYGETVVIELELTDELAFTDPVPDFVVDVRLNGQSLVDKSTGVVNLGLGTMARESADNYYTASQIEELFAQVLSKTTALSELADELERSADGMTRAIYNIIAERPIEDEHDDHYGYYIVMANTPFMLMLQEGQVDLKVCTSNNYLDRGDTFTSIRCVDSADITRYADVPISQLPKNMPFIGVYDTESDPHLFKSGMMLLPDYYLESSVAHPNNFIPQVADNTAIASYGMQFTSHALDITEETVAAALEGDYTGIRGETDGN